MPARKPRTLKLINGTSPHEINTSEPVPSTEEPLMPTWFDLSQQQTWKHTVRQLRAMRLLAASDYDNLVNYVVAADLCRRISIQLADIELTVLGGHGSLHGHPLLIVLDRAMARVTALGREFGLTPSSRASLRMLTDADTVGAKDSPEAWFASN
jgi:P27 family predicted phage terminase small subunit